MSKQISTLKILWKTICLGLKVKTPFSLVVSLVAIPTALLPLLLSIQLQRLTDLLFDITTHGEVMVLKTIEALILLGVTFILQLFFQALVENNTINDSYRTRIYMKEYILRQVCQVQYPYLENKDNFLKKIEFADTWSATEISRNIQNIFLILQQLITFVSISISLWIIHPCLVFVIVATSIPAALLSYRQSDETFRSRAKWMKDGHFSILLYHFCASSEDGIQEVRHYELFDYLKARWRAVADSYIFQKRQLTTKHLKSNLIADFLRSAVYLVILLLTAWIIYKNPIVGLGVFTLVYTLSDRLQKATGSILTLVMQFSTSLAYLREFFALEEIERESNQRKVSKENENVDSKGEIHFENVSFTYPNSEQEVLHDISVSIQGGEKIAIVGDNGSGKSTFISLLTGMFAPNKGLVNIDGMSMKENKQELRNRISVIFQDFAHYEATLRDNITVSDMNRRCSDEEIKELARKIHVEDVITQQPQGLDGLLGHLSPKGNDLSGGQWQKIALLRAAYRNNTNIMILDEPTAALDPISEAELYRNFAELTGNRTTILISHRLGITKLVDRILVFHDGRIIEDGSHEELMKRKGHYYDMYCAQASWYQTN